MLWVKLLLAGNLGMGAAVFPCTNFVVGSEEAPIEGLASVRHSNGTCGFPAFRFHEWPREVRREGSVRQGYLAHQRVDLLLLTFERQMIG